MRVLPGIELSSRGDGLSVHVLGYLPGVLPQPLADTLARVISVRGNRNLAILERLAELGVPVEWDDVVQRARGTVGRPHIADAMVAAGHVTRPRRGVRALPRGRRAGLRAGRAP